MEDSKTLVIGLYFDEKHSYGFIKAIKNLDPNFNYVADFSQCEYIDSMGLGALLMLRNFTTGNNKCVVLRHLKGHVADVVRMANFRQIFTIED